MTKEDLFAPIREKYNELKELIKENQQIVYESF